MRKKINRQGKDGKRSSNPPSLQEHNPPVAAPEASENEQQAGGNKPRLTKEGFSFAMAVAVTVATVANVLVTGLQWYAMRDQLSQASKANVIAAASMEASSRAWVVLKEVRCPLDDDSCPPVIPNKALDPVRLVFENVGHSPATNVSGVGTSIVAVDLRTALRHQKQRYSRSSRTNIGPGHEQPFPIPLSRYSDAQVEAIKTGTRKLFIFGHLTYEDVLSKERLTEFCLFYKLDTNDWVNCLRHTTMK